MHSKNIEHLSAFAKAVETTIFVKNAPSYAGIGFGGEGHTTFTIAGPTGEGIISARSFTRKRRFFLIKQISIKIGFEENSKPILDLYSRRNF